MDRETHALRAIRILERGQLRLAMLALAVMMLTTVADVALRYIFGHPIHGAYDVVEVCLAIFVFNGMATVFYGRKNVVIDLIDHIVSPTVARILVRAGEVAMIAILLLMLWAMVAPATQAYEYGDRKLELGLPVYVIWVFVLAGVAGATICALGALMGRVEDRHGVSR